MAANDMDGALRRVLQPGGEVVPGCDPELNAAYAERRLRGAEQQKLEAHLAACADCRKLVTEWMAEETPDAVSAPRPAWWRWRWAVPALAGVAVVASMVVYNRPHREEEKKVALQQVAALPAEPPAANEPVTATKPPQARLEARAKRVVARARDEAERFAAAPVPAAPPAAQAPSAGPSVGASQVAQEAQLAKLKDEAGAAQRREGDQQGTAAGLAVQRSDAARQNVQNLRAASLLPDGTAIRGQVQRGVRLWAVSEAGRLFRSVDSGASWQPLDTPATVPLVRVEWDPQGDVLVVGDREGRSFRIQP